MEGEMPVEDMKIKVEEQDLQEAFNEIMGEEEFISEELIQDEIKNKMCREESISDELIQDEIIIKNEIGQDESISDELIQDEIIKNKMGQDESISDELIQDEIIKNDMGQEESICDEMIPNEMGQEENISVELIQDEIIKKEIDEEENICDEMIQDEIIKNEMHFDDTNGGEVTNHLPSGDSHLQNLVEKYKQIRKLGSRGQRLCVKSSLVKKKRAFSRCEGDVKVNTRDMGGVLHKVLKSKRALKCKSGATTECEEDGCLQQKELVENKQEPAHFEADCSNPDLLTTWDSDEMLYCDDCCRSYEEECPEHGPLLIVEDSSFSDNFDDDKRAEKTSPPQVSVLNSEAENGVWARYPIPARMRFGPFEGKIVPPDVHTAYSWLIRKNGRADHCVDATEPSLSNWMRYVNCARHNGQQNLHAFQYKGKIFYRTIRPIDPGEELLVWFGDEYSRQLGLDLQAGHGYTEMCPDCPYPCASPMYLLEHKKHSHKDLGNSEKSAKKAEEISRRIRRSYNRSAKLSISYRETPDFNTNYSISNVDINVDNLKPTMNPETGEQCYACPECNKYILRRSHLKRHLLIHSDVKPYYCKFCSKGFARKDNFDAHMKLRHSYEAIPLVRRRKRPSFVKRTKSIELSKERQPTDQGKERQPTDQGKERQPTDQGKERQPKDQGKERQPIDHSKECQPIGHSKEYQPIDRSNESQPINHSNESQPIDHSNENQPTDHKNESQPVGQSKERPSTRGHLSRRQQALVGNNQFVCNECDMRFSRAAEVRAHMAAHESEKPFGCDVCRKRFLNKAGLNSHLKNAHKTSAPIAKPVVPLVVKPKFSNSRKMKINTALMCKVCGLQCRSEEHLTTHEHTHDDRFSICFVCGKKFSHVNHLKRHLLIHAGYRPHGCPHCGQGFSRSEHLKRHIRTHTRQGAYECGKCKKRFAKKMEFDRHVRLHNKDAPCLQDQRLSMNLSLQRQLKSYLNDEEHFNQDGCNNIKQEEEDFEDEDDEPLLNVFPEVILGAEI